MRGHIAFVLISSSDRSEILFRSSVRLLNVSFRPQLRRISIPLRLFGGNWGAAVRIFVIVALSLTPTGQAYAKVVECM